MDTTTQVTAPSSTEAPVNKETAQNPKETNVQNVAPSAAPTEKDAANQGNATIRKFKLKVDGQDLELDEPEVIRRAQLSTAAQKRFDEAQQKESTAREFIQKLKTNPFEVIDDPRLGLSQDQKIAWVEDWYRSNVIEPSTLTPEQRQIKEQQAKLKSFEDKDKAAQETARQQQLQQLEAHHTQNFQKQIVEGLGSEGIPKTEYTVRRMADLMAKNIKLGLELTPAQLATLVREDYITEQKALFSSADGESLLKLMDEGVINKIRKADLARLRAGTPELPRPVVDVAKPNTAKTEKQWKSLDEEHAEREKRVAQLASGWGKK
jgi:hypothetical protein